MATSNLTSLKVSDIHKNFGSEIRSVEVLRGVSFDMIQGQKLALTGPSGSGKSTLLHLIGTLGTPSAGKIEINAENPFGLSEPRLARFRNQVIGFVSGSSPSTPIFGSGECLDTHLGV
jgi:lipoprotein-releasing system ATP-binding protein